MPEKIGRFSVLGKLGEGGMGVVYLARDAELERKIAIKVMLPGGGRGIGVRRLVREAQGLARLSHPYVIQVHEIGEHDSAMFIAMEYVEGRTLSEWLDAEPRGWRSTLEILRQSGRGLDAAHAAGLIHRDFKPGNVIVGIDGRARVLDFGLARDHDDVDADVDDDSSAANAACTGDDALEVGDTLADSDARASPETSLTRSGVILGTPAYMAPEQMQGRPCDPLSDLFSFCVTAFEALFHTRPFSGSTFAELALNVDDGNVVAIPEHTAVPLRVQKAILRGLAPRASERWPSMHALLDELDEIVSMEDIQAYLERTRDARGRIEAPPGGATNFHVPERLYGRQRQVEALLECFESVRAGTARPRLMLITGLAGIGKSSLVDALRPIVAAASGLMFAGKFEPLARASPLAGIVDALGDLVSQLATLDPTMQQRLRHDLQAAAGRNLALLGELVPALARLFGDAAAAGPGLERAQVVDRFPAVQATSGAFNRIHVAITRFLLGLASPDRPFVLFVDDLQWADSASLAFIEYLLSNESPRALLVVGTCRNSDVGPRHSLRALLDKVQLHGVSVEQIELEPLMLSDAVALLEDTLSTTGASLHELARFALGKTEGNPFYLRHLLRTIYDEGLFHFDVEAGAWVWEFERIAASSAFDSVGEVLLRKLASLSSNSLRLIQIASCVGQRVELLTLAAVAERNPVEVFSDLWPTIEQGLLLIEGGVLSHLTLLESTTMSNDRSGVVVRFRHARIQEAASESLATDDRRRIQVEIGRTLRRRFVDDEHGVRAFEIADHLNAGRMLLDDDERTRLVELDLACGRRAIESGAYGSGIDYLTIASELLGPQASTDERHEMYFAVEFERARALNLDGRGAEAKGLYDALLEIAVGKAEQLAVTTALVEFALLVTDLEVGYAASRRGFALLGMKFPERDEDALAMFAAELEELEYGLAGRSPIELLALPLVDDAEAELLHGLGALSYRASHPNINGWTITRTVNLALRTGNSKISTVAYARLTAHLSHGGDYVRAQAFGQLAVALCERYDDPSTTGRAYIAYFGHSAYYDYPLLDLLPKFEAAHYKCLEAGVLLYAGFHLHCLFSCGVTAGIPLRELMADIETHIGFLRRSVPGLFVSHFLPHIFTVCTLMDIPLAQLGLSFDPASHVQTVAAAGPDAAGLHYAGMIQLDYLLGQRHELNEIERRLGVVEAAMPYRLHIHETRYYMALSLLDQLATRALDEGQRERALKLIETWRADFSRRSARCPINFRHKHVLLEAELVRATGGPLEQAVDRYEQAIEASQEARCLDHEALAWWRFGEFWLSRGSKHTARAYLATARERYESWGATRMVRELDMIR
jgi:predicted ATPase/predicted Ser/Thr protein kinase